MLSSASETVTASPSSAHQSLARILPSTACRLGKDREGDWCGRPYQQHVSVQPIINRIRLGTMLGTMDRQIGGAERVGWTHQLVTGVPQIFHGLCVFHDSWP